MLSSGAEPEALPLSATFPSCAVNNPIKLTASCLERDITLNCLSTISSVAMLTTFPVHHLTNDNTKVKSYQVQR